VEGLRLVKGFGGGIGASFTKIFSFLSIVGADVSPVVVEVEDPCFAKDFGRRIGIPFFGANLPLESRVRERGGLSEDPIEARFLAEVRVELLGFVADFPCSSLSREYRAVSTSEEPIKTRFSAVELPGVPSFGANLPRESLTNNGVPELEDIDVLRLFGLIELDTEEELFAANLPLESRFNEFVFFSLEEVELVGPPLFRGVTGSSSWKIQVWL
jgi:hypothetical protein